ncbi:MAG: hypothetical protein WBM04_09210 [Candidatus Korobacteraceae bacterium]
MEKYRSSKLVCITFMFCVAAVIASPAQTLSSVTVSVDGTGSVTSTDGYINCPDACSYLYPLNTAVTLNASAAEGWTFTGWSGACTGTGSCDVTMTSSQSVTATFMQNIYTLTVSTSGDGTVASTDINCPDACSQITLNASAAGGWTFTGWSGACTGTGSCDVTMTSNQSVTATFTQNTYTLTVSASGNGTVSSADGFINCPGACSYSYLSNTQVTLNASPAADWALSSWSGTRSGTGSCVVDMTQSQSVGATFTQVDYTLTVSTNGNGTVTSNDGFISCPGSCANTYLRETLVTLDAVPGEGWVFGGWNGGCSGTGACTVTMTQSLTIDAIFSQALQFVAVAPCRLVDTRNPNGPFGGPPLQARTARSFPIPQQTPCDIPATAAAYSLNVTLVPIGGQSVGLLTIWPTGESQPIISTMNSWDGRFKANAAIVPAGTEGAVSIYASNTTNVVLDIDGYFEPAGGSTLAFYPLAPCRVADTRWTIGDLGGPYLTAKQERTLPVLESTCGIPDTAQAYSFNFTASPRGAPVWVFRAWPDGLSQPGTSTLNAPTGTVAANAAIVPAGANGAIDVWASNDSDVAIDVNGYFAPAGSGGLSLYPAAPCRVLDTRRVRTGAPFTGPLSPPVNPASGLCGVPSTAQAYVFNATIVPQGVPVWLLTLWPDGLLKPHASTLNAWDDAVTSNLAIVSTTNGSIDAYAAGLTHLILDISSYFAP